MLLFTSLSIWLKCQWFEVFSIIFHYLTDNAEERNIAKMIVNPSGFGGFIWDTQHQVTCFFDFQFVFIIEPKLHGKCF